MKIRAMLALLLALAGLVLVGPAATAQPARHLAYPPTTCPTLAVSTTKPAVGETITVTGRNFDAHASVTVVMHSRTYVLAKVRTDASGSFSTGVTMPAGLTGHHIIQATGAQSACPADPIEIVITGTTTASAGTGGPGGGTALTGVDILGLLVAALAMIGAGVLLNRRRGQQARRSRA